MVDRKLRGIATACISSKAPSPIITPRGDYHTEREHRPKKKKKDKTHRSGRKHPTHQKGGSARVVHRRLEAHHVEYPSRQDFRTFPSLP